MILQPPSRRTHRWARPCLCALLLVSLACQPRSEREAGAPDSARLAAATGPQLRPGIQLEPLWQGAYVAVSRGLDTLPLTFRSYDGPRESVWVADTLWLSRDGTFRARTISRRREDGVTTRGDMTERGHYVAIRAPHATSWCDERSTAHVYFRPTSRPFSARDTLGPVPPDSAGWLDVVGNGGRLCGEGWHAWLPGGTGGLIIETYRRIQ